MKKLRFSALLLSLLLLLCSCSNSSADTSGGEYIFVTGKSGGTYNSLGTSMAAIWASPAV